MILRLIAVFLATTAFAVIFNAPKKDLFLCGCVGLWGWFVYEICVLYFNSNTLHVFLSTAAVTALSRILAFRRKKPITVYLISGIIPLVPGAGVYYTMYNILADDAAQAMIKGVETLKISGAIALGIMTVLSLPYWLFKHPSESKIMKKK